MQQGYRLYLWTAFGSLATLGGIVACATLHTGLNAFVCVSVFGPLLASFGNWALYFGRIEPRLRPRLHLFRLQIARRIASGGTIFLAQQIFSAFAYGVDGLIIVRIMGPSAVAEYSVAQRLFAMALLSQFLSLPLWPAFGDALARRDGAWLKKSIPRSAVLNVGMNVAAGAFLVLFGTPLIKYWTVNAVVPGLAILIAFAARSGQQGFDETISAFLNHEGTMLQHLIYYGAAAVSSLFLKIAMCYLWGSVGVLWASVIAFSLLHALPSLALIRKTLRRLDATPPLTPSLSGNF
jgi:O-antigen/teichoic acid export membrane protein